jgi:type IV secretory pathway ATPase VirB11/archaellum biosynthesis ATPase
MDGLGTWLRGDESDEPDEGGCGCVVTVDGEGLVVDADGCDHGGHLADSPACRARVVRSVTERTAGPVTVRASGRERLYDGRGGALLVAAGRFRERVAYHDERLAARAAREPLAAAREATGRAGPVADVAATCGLAETADGLESYDQAFAPARRPAVSHWRVRPAPAGATLTASRTLETGARVCLYDRADGLDEYHLAPVERKLDADATATLAAAADRLTGTTDTGVASPAAAVRAVAGSETPVTVLTRVLRKHTRGYGLLEDVFADPAVSDAFLTAPVTENPLRVRVGGETRRTNLRLDEAGVAALASRFRLESGRGFSRAAPTLDAGTEIADRSVRVAGLHEPVSEGVAFAFRAHDGSVWRLPALLRNDTLSPGAAGLLSVAVERGRSVLLAGPRGAGKTTLLGALLWTLPADVRTVVIEDTPELPVGPLQEAGRDVQAMRADASDALAPAEALRAALRLGDGALVVGEIRGEEAPVLYEAMRVGANSEAVLGTVHGDGATAVYERVVSDLGVEPTAFAATDLVVTLERAADGNRQVRAVEEVVGTDPPGFETLYERGDGLGATGRVDRGNSRLVAALARPSESYGEVRETVETRATRLGRRAGVSRVGS